MVELKISESSGKMVIQVMPSGSCKWQEGMLFEAVTATGKEVEVFVFKKDAETLKTLLSEYGDIRIQADEVFNFKAKATRIQFLYKKVHQLVNEAV